MKKILVLVILTLVVVLGVLYFVQQPASQPQSEPQSDTTSPQATPTLTPGGSDDIEANIYLIALEGRGADLNDEEIGCGDSLVSVPSEQDDPTLESVFAELLSIESQTYAEQDYYNALNQSDLSVSQVTVENSVASVYLVGDFVIGGVCDSPRVEAQLSETALQFPGVDQVEIFINNERLDELLSGEGE